jgi:hypothetical protein
MLYTTFIRISVSPYDSLQDAGETFSIYKDNLLHFSTALAGPYLKKKDFDIALFAALRLSLQAYIITDTEDTPVNNNDKLEKKPIIIDNRNTAAHREYAVGFVSAGSAGLNLIPERQRNDTTASTSSGMQAIAHKPDHSVCLFRCNREKNRWEAMDYFAVVELKFSNTACGVFRTEHDTNKVLPPIKFLKEHAAFGEEILCNLGSVLHTMHAEASLVRACHWQLWLSRNFMRIKRNIGERWNLKCASGCGDNFTSLRRVATVFVIRSMTLGASPLLTLKNWRLAFTFTSCRLD